MNETQNGNGLAAIGSSWMPAGGFLERLPKGLYLAAHVAFLAGGIWLWARASEFGLPYSGAFVLYALSQLGFLAYFANIITMKMAVLVEQTLVFALVALIVLRAT